MEFEQIAIHDSANFDLLRLFKNELGHSQWSGDTVYSTGRLRDISLPSHWRAIENVADLWFNYTIVPGKEFELLHYHNGRNFLENQPHGTISHFGLHVSDIQDHHQALIRRGFELVQEVITQKHASPGVKNRHYHYAIYDHPKSKFFWKLIERIDPVNVKHRTDAILERCL